jgi:hypothetical protein
LIHVIIPSVSHRWGCFATYRITIEMGTWGRGHKTGACSSAASSLDIASPAEDKLGGGSMPGEDVAPLQQVSILGTAFFFWWDQEFESGFLQRRTFLRCLRARP